MLYLVRVAAALTAWGVLSAAMCHAADCQSLAGRRFNQARIIATDEMTSPFKAANIATPKGVLVKSAFCRVRGVIEPAADSEIQFEVWLPGPAAWNGRYQGVGNGGFAGAVIYQAMNWALEGGYAVAGSDTGHTGAMDDSSWRAGAS